MAKEPTHVNFTLSNELAKELDNCNTKAERGKKILIYINKEIQNMDSWAIKELGGPGAKFENAYLRTYLYRKITGAL